MDSSERGMNLVAMTIIDPRKEYWPSRGSNQRSPVLQPCALPTDLWGSAISVLKADMQSFAYDHAWTSPNDKRQKSQALGENLREKLTKDEAFT